MASEPRQARWKRTSRTLGQGGQAQVVVVVDSTGTLQGEYALKVLSNVQRTPRLDLEINTTKSLSQLGAPVLPIVDDYIVSEPDALHPWYVSPVADGGDLGKALAKGAPLSANLADALRVFAEIAAAVGVLHTNGIAHRDLKPANILIANGKYLLCDLGLCLPLATDQGSDRLTDTLERIGSLNYTPPEAFGRQVLGQQQIAFDAYALGKILYELVAGRPLPGFLGPDDPDYDLTRRFTQPIYAGINMLLRELLHIDPQRRLQALQHLDKRVEHLIEWAESGSRAEAGDQWRDKMATAGDLVAKFAIASPKVGSDEGKAECDAIGRRLLAVLQESKPLSAVSEQLIASHPDSLELTIVEGAQLRNVVSGAFVRSRRALEPLEDAGYPIRPLAESGCCATFQTKESAPLLPTLFLGALVALKNDHLHVGLGIAERPKGSEQPVDFIPATTHVITAARGDPDLLRDASVLVDQSAAQFAEILLERISQLRPS